MLHNRSFTLNVAVNGSRPENLFEIYLKGKQVGNSRTRPKVEGTHFLLTKIRGG